VSPKFQDLVGAGAAVGAFRRNAEQDLGYGQREELGVRPHSSHGWAQRIIDAFVVTHRVRGTSDLLVQLRSRSDAALPHAVRDGHAH
jgi:hypothetical protein